MTVSSIFARCHNDVIAAVDCEKITLKSGILASDIDTVAVTISSTSLKPVHSAANRLVYHVWDITDVDLQVTDTLLSRVMEWDEGVGCSLLSTERYQNARMMASAVITSGENSFTATNILPLIANKVRTERKVFELYLKSCCFFSAVGSNG